MIFFTKTRLFLIAFVFLLLTDASIELQAQTNQCPSCWVPVYRHRLVPSVNISNSIKGYAELLPFGYAVNTTKKYPLILFINGIGSVGDGQSVATLCNSICGALPLKIEEKKYSDTVYANGQPYSFIVLSPQITSFNTVNSSDIQSLVNYAIANYRVDINRIYLTGLSSGASLIMDYMSSSATEANRIAAVVTLATCNSSNTSGASNFGTQKIRYWGLHCAADNICGAGNTTNWANAINSYSPPGNPMAKYTLTSTYNPSFPHDIWYITYDSAYKENNLNVTQWMIQYSRNFAQTTLPAAIDRYEVFARNNQVITEWTTNQESNSNYFVIERAGGDLRFLPIGKVSAAGNSSTPVSYSFLDPSPKKGISYYRLSLVNKDGLQNIFDIKKVNIRSFGATFSLTPVPANNNLLLSFDLESSQQLQFVIRDINGRTLQSWSANFTSGYANIPISIQKLTPGVYHLSIQGNSVLETKKFVRL